MIDKEKDPNTLTKRGKGIEIAKTWISGTRSVTLILERSIAEKYGLTEPSHVVLEATEEGILIKKLEV